MRIEIEKISQIERIKFCITSTEFLTELILCRELSSLLKKTQAGKMSPNFIRVIIIALSLLFFILIIGRESFVQNLEVVKEKFIQGF